jgi:transcriptional regulator with XRE-family HTH domain
MEESTMQFKDILKQLRKSNKLTQKELAENIGVSEITIRSYESGRRLPNSETLVKLENYFNVSGAYLRGKTEEKERMIWDDQEIMQTIHEEIPTQLSSFSAELLKQSDKNQKLMFDLFVELKSILTLEDEKTKDDLIDLIHQNVCSIVRVSNKLPK